METRNFVVTFLRVLLVLMATMETTALYGVKLKKKEHRNAYATMMYMGTPRDYEFYVATRVLIKSLVSLQVDADLIVIASLDVPLRWIRALEEEDGAKVVRVENINNPYTGQQKRFKLTLNKLYAWSLVDYERVVMLDADNLFLQKTDELFQCGQFCAVFINPCIFHTGLFVLQPSGEVFKDMIHSLETGKENPDGADQGFIGAYFPDLLDQPMFHPPLNGSNLDGQYRLPLGYQMDASYYYLRLRWRVPCGPNSVITFPGALWLKPWYWWSWPVLPLGIQWHENRRQTLGYAAEMPIVIIQSIIFLGIIVMTHLARPTIPKLCYRNSDKTTALIQTAIKFIAIWSILAANVVPFAIIPRTIHPLVGWALYFLGSIALSSIAINSFMLPAIQVFVPLIGIFGSLLVMAYPWYPNGVVRALAVFGYACCYAPIAWGSVLKVLARLHVSLEREQFFPKLAESSPPSGINKLC
ncbi:putative glucuronosyltransferase PGSIP7 [Hibiscus syriacus]|uniref:Glucuronosyltransferase PGSIP7 n=1 Tax=Hibiscus syriacus TaxID=106335 RepID=A0A6A3AV80_HIBSY|nr:putative glucuronosyltransferase PGSIP8 isoform X2 [Hibiscus syriacus]KAE8708640.1 putative glucuronosyltransferase PGSIP7 [Hibiscus syriacus]